MEILVCVKRVPDTSENDIELNGSGNDIERDDLVYSINEPDNYAVEEALQIVAKVGGKVSVVTVGSDEDEEVLRREMAMGATHGGTINSKTSVSWQLIPNADAGGKTASGQQYKVQAALTYTVLGVVKTAATRLWSYTALDRGSQLRLPASRSLRTT